MSKRLIKKIPTLVSYLFTPIWRYLELIGVLIYISISSSLTLYTQQIEYNRLTNYLNSLPDTITKKDVLYLADSLNYSIQLDNNTILLNLELALIVLYLTSLTKLIIDTWLISRR